jgi:hypothetical protein
MSSRDVLGPLILTNASGDLVVRVNKMGKIEVHILSVFEEKGEGYTVVAEIRPDCTGGHLLFL